MGHFQLSFNNKSLLNKLSAFNNHDTLIHKRSCTTKCNSPRIHSRKLMELNKYTCGLLVLCFFIL